MKEDAHCEPAVMDSEDMLFLLYTSGSTGKPKGLVHSQAGYLLFAALTHKVMEPSHRVLVSWQFIDSAGNRCAVLLHYEIIFIQNKVSEALLEHQPSRAHLPTGSREEQHMLTSRASQKLTPLSSSAGILAEFRMFLRVYGAFGA